MLNVDRKLLAGYTFIDLFAGLGGFRLAMESLGAECVFSCEWDSAVANVYQQNFGDLPHGDITKISEDSIPNHDILCAGFPCQAFSISGKQRGFEDSRGTLFFEIARIVKKIRPKVVFLENVKNFATHDNGKTLSVVRQTIQDLGYNFTYKVLNASDYGIPQNRQRIYMVCFRKDVDAWDFEFPNPLRLERFVEDVLLDDPVVVATLGVERDDITINKPLIDFYRNKPIRIGTVNKGGQGERIYSKKGVAITLSAYGGGVFAKTGGYLVDDVIRKLHPRECARLMGFPDSYQIASRQNQAYKQFGNSVVIDVIQYIGIQVAKALDPCTQLCLS